MSTESNVTNLILDGKYPGPVTAEVYKEGLFKGGEALVEYIEQAKGYAEEVKQHVLSPVTIVHDLDIPFNDGISLLHGYGPVTFSRASTASDVNKSGIPSTYAVNEPVITSSGIASFGESGSRKQDFITVPQIGNLPKPREAFYIMVDVDASGDSGQLRTILSNIYYNYSYVGIDSYNRYIIVPPKTGGSQGEVLTSSKRVTGKARLIFAFDDTLRIYEDGVLVASKDNNNFTDRFYNELPLNIGRLNNSMPYNLNGYTKRLRIRHGVITDSLAKIYGKWGE